MNLISDAWIKVVSDDGGKYITDQISISSLLIDSPGEHIVKQNRDLFKHGNL